MLRHWVADPTARLITLVGPGGVGKTRLALELARGIAQQGSTRAVFVPLAAVREHVFVGPAIAEALGIADVAAVGLAERAHASPAARTRHGSSLIISNRCSTLRRWWRIC